MTARSPLRSLLAVLLVVAGCYGGGSTPTPAGSTLLFEELTRAGFRIHGAVAGDAGCDDPSLADNATHLRLALPPDEADRDLYLLIFRPRDFGAEGARVDECRMALERATNVVMDHIGVAPYRTYGGSWTPAWREALTRVLTTAARGGAAP